MLPEGIRHIAQRVPAVLENAGNELPRSSGYLRTLLIHGARSAILAAKRRGECENVWLTTLLNRRHAKIAAVELANKNVRTVWALLAHGRDFNPDYVPARAAKVGMYGCNLYLRAIKS